MRRCTAWVAYADRCTLVSSLIVSAATLHNRSQDVYYG